MGTGCDIIATVPSPQLGLVPNDSYAFFQFLTNEFPFVVDINLAALLRVVEFFGGKHVI